MITGALLTAGFVMLHVVLLNAEEHAVGLAGLILIPIIAFIIAVSSFGATPDWTLVKV